MIHGFTVIFLYFGGSDRAARPLPGGGPGDRFALFAVAYDMPDASSVRLVAEDSAGNAAQRKFVDQFFPQPPRAADIVLETPFLERVVAENLADSLAVVDLASGRVTQRLATGPYPYTVAVAPEGTVFVSNWGASTLSVFARGADGRLTAQAALPVARHPSALLLSADGRRLFVASGSTDRIAVVDARARRVLGELPAVQAGQLIG